MNKIIAGIVVLVVSFIASKLYIFHSIGMFGMLIGIALIVWGALAKKPNVNAEAEAAYNKAATNDGTKFDISPARVPFPVGAAFFFGIPSILGVLACIAAGDPSFGVIPIVLGVAAIWFIWRGGPASKFREPTTFLVSQDGIAINGRKLPANDIHRLILRNHVDGSQIVGPSFQGPVVAYDVSSATGAVAASSLAIAAGVAATGEVLAQRRRMKIQRIAYRLDAELGGKAVTLACGMDETTAFGLMTDVANILGMR